MWCHSKIPHSKAETAVIQYGIELLLETITKIVLLIIIAAVCNKTIEVIIVLAIFGTLRSQAGGYHFNSNIGCTFAMVIVCTISIYLSEIFVFSNLLIIIIFLLIVIMVYLFAPADFSNNNNFNEKQKQKNKIHSLLVISIFFAIVLFVDKESIKTLIVSASIFEVISIIPIYKKERINE